MIDTEPDVRAVRALADEIAGQREPASLARAWLRVTAADRPRPRIRRRLRASVAIPVAAALAVALVAGVGALLLRGSPSVSVLAGGDSAIPVDQAWRELLQKAQTIPAATVPAGTVLYVRTTAAGASIKPGSTAPWPMVDQSNGAWYDPATMRLLRVVSDHEGVTQPGHLPPASPIGLFNASPQWIDRLPATADELGPLLLDQAAADAGNWSTRHGLWEAVAELFHRTDLAIPPAVRVALYQVLAQEKGLTASRVSIDGRDLIAITRVERTDGQQLLFDPATGRGVGNRSFYLGHDEPGAPADGLMSWAVWEQAVVAETGRTN
jgi:hypothetical protein